VRIFLLTLILLASAPAAVHAQVRNTCAGSGSQPEVNECAIRLLERADSALNQVFPQALQAQDERSRPLFRAAQEQWERFRQAECDAFAENVHEALAYPSVHAGCLARLARERTAALRQVVELSPRDAIAWFAVVSAADSLFAAMQARDTAALRTLMHPRAQIVAVGDNGVSVRSADEWIGGLRRNNEELRERMWDPRVEIDGGLATLWAPYDFHLGERFSHCGTEAFQFVREGNAWRLIAITFTGRTTGCDEPR
jgi:uncharacterized protein YecT (DUF1311 family)